MEPEEVVLMDGYTLMDAMSAFEVRTCTASPGVSLIYRKPLDVYPPDW